MQEDVWVNNSCKKRLSDSVFDFERLIKPKLVESQIIKGDVISVELATAEKYKDLITLFDTLAGIDAWIINKKTGIQGLASRIQWGKDWQTFTVRYKLPSGNETEYHKRLRALKTGEYLYPEYTLQAYISEPRTGYLRSLAIVKTIHIFDMIEAGICWEMPNSKDGNIFLCVKWKKMQDKGYPIEIFE